jgi:protein-tyrosine phosphatase
MSRIVGVEFARQQSSGVLGRDPTMRLVNLLFVCTANQCRSPMAAGWARRLAEERGLPVDVDSAGFLGGGVSPPPHAVAVMDSVGIDLRGHRSQALTPALAESADAVATMTRQHLIDLLDLAPGAWPRCFTLTDLVRRAEAQSSRPRDGAPDVWLRSLGADRSRMSILSLARANDVDDPMGRPLHEYQHTRDILGDLIARLLDALV